MKKGGFTLIELLAVIVILAILSLITIPIVLNIIDNSKKKSNLRSIEGYARVLEETVYTLKIEGVAELNDEGLMAAISKAQYTGMSVSCKMSRIINDRIELNECKVGKDTGYCYKNGKAFYGDECPINNNIESSLSIVTSVTEENKTIGNVPRGLYSLGDEYIINVDGTNKYHFFVLSTDEYNVNLIMDRNICEDGTLATEYNLCRVAWCSESTDNSFGPITAMNYLNESTKNWANIPNININYIDEGNNYGVIKTNQNTTIITNNEETITATYMNLKARLPMISEVSNAGCSNYNSNSLSNSCPLWLANNLNDTKNDNSGATNISDIYGYWTLSSYENDDYFARNIIGTALYYYDDITSEYYNGIRPVISISKSEF